MSECRIAHKSVYGENTFDNDYYLYQDNQKRHQLSWTLQLIAGAVAFQGLKAYQDYLRRTGEKMSHFMMQEMITAFAVVEVDKLFETIQLDFIDREKTKHQAIQQAHYLAEQQYRLSIAFNYQQQKIYSNPQFITEDY